MRMFYALLGKSISSTYSVLRVRGFVQPKKGGFFYSSVHCGSFSEK